MARRRVDHRTFDLFAPAIRAASTDARFPTFHAIDPAQVELRPYLDFVRSAWSRGGHLGVVAQTAIGKSYAAFVLADGVLAVGQRVVVCAPTNLLCSRHAEVATRIFRLPPEAIAFIRSGLPAVARTAAWRVAQIAVATPYVVANDLAAGRCTFDGVGLVVIDECHHAARRHASIAVADAAEKAGARILALTASPGGSRERIVRIQTNLHLPDWLLVPESATDPYRPPVDATRVDVEIPEPAWSAVRHLEDALARRVATLVAAGVLTTTTAIPSPRDLQRTIQAVRGRSAFELIPIAAAALQLTAILTTVVSDDYPLALDKLADACCRRKPKQKDGGAPNAREEAGTKRPFTVTAKSLRTDPAVVAAGTILRSLVNDGVPHHKHAPLLSVLRTTLERPGARVLVFNRYAEGARRLHDTCTAAGISCGLALGRARQRPGKTVEVVRAFEHGEFPVLIATAVIREGVHIPGIDLLVEYTPPLNEIERIQLRGRVGRDTPGRIVTIAAAHNLDLRYVYSSASKERTMRRILNRPNPHPPTHPVARNSAFHTRVRKPIPTFIDRLEPGLVFERFSVLDATIVESRHGPYARFRVGDRTGSIELIHRCPEGRPQAEAIVTRVPAGTVAIVAGRYEDGDRRRIVVDPRRDHRVIPCPINDYDPADYAVALPF